MKSRISFFDKTLFRKNLTRFAPCWGLYTVILLLIQLLILDSSQEYLAQDMANYIQVMASFTAIYALICAELLFGDLYNSRMCNAIHALPLRRETILGTNLISGLAFQLVPTFVIFLIALASLLCTGMPHAWIVAPAWLLALNLQFVFFFALAILSAMCVGSRFAQALVYGILNFGSVLVGFLVDTLIVPMYYGIRINMDPFVLLSPVVQMSSYEFVDLERVYASSTHYDRVPEIIDYIPHIGESFFYHFVIAVIAVGILLLALRMYRRRNLEAAGDFIAVPALRPVFLLIYSILSGILFQLITDGLFGLGGYLGLWVGLAVGWFTGLMLLNRTPKIFSGKNLGRCGLLLLACIVILGAAALDPFGIESWMPDQSEIESVTLSDGYYDYYQAQVTLEDPADIQRVLEMHREALEIHQEENQPAATTSPVPYDYEDHSRNYSMNVTFTYRLHSGRTVKRYYHIWLGGETGDDLCRMFSSPLAVFGHELTPQEFAVQNPTLMLHDTYDGQSIYLYGQQVMQLYEAMLLDCAEGNLCQVYSLLPGHEILFWLNDNDPNHAELHITTAAAHTLQALRDLGADVDSLLEKMGLDKP